MSPKPTLPRADLGSTNMPSGPAGWASDMSTAFPQLILSHSGSALTEEASGQLFSRAGSSIEAKVITPRMEAAAQIALRSSGCSGAESFVLKSATLLVQ